MSDRERLSTRRPTASRGTSRSRKGSIAIARSDLKRRLQRRARRASVSLEPGVCDELIDFLELLARWNSKINLTSLPLRDPSDETLDRLIVEPLAAVRHLPSRRCRVLDVGSGGGSPAIPLKIAVPEASLRMVESKTRKCAFLGEAARLLHLDQVWVEPSRLEELLIRPDLHEAHDVVLLRAVRMDAGTLRTVQTLLAPTGRVFLFRASVDRFSLPEEVVSLEIEARHALVEAVGSQLVVLRNRMAL